MEKMDAKLVWKDAHELGLDVAICVDDPDLGIREMGRMLAPGQSQPRPVADIRAVLEGQRIVSLAALTADGLAFCDLVRSGALA